MNGAKDILDYLNKIENRFPIGEWVSQGIDIWPLLRFSINTKLNYRILNIEEKLRNNKPLYQIKLIAGINALKQKAKGFLYKHLLDKTNNDILEERDILFLANGAGYFDVDGVFYEKYFDQLANRFKLKDFSLLRLDLFHRYVRKRFSKSIYIQADLENKLIYELIRKRKISHDVSKLKGFQTFLDFAQKENLIFSIEAMNLRLNKISVMIDFFEEILKKVKPKVVILSCYYGDYSVALVHACWKNKIPSIDIQHGVQGDLHAAYGRWENVPKKGYNVVPDLFWCWSVEEAESINKWSSILPRHQAFVGGNIAQQLWHNNHFFFVKTYAKKLDETIRNHPLLNSNNKNILLSLQWDISDEEDLKEIFLAMKKTQHKYNWWLRLHPAMLDERARIRQLLQDYEITICDLDAATDTPLYILLKRMNLHITHSSSVVLEAESFGIRSIVTSDYGAEFYSRQIQDGIAYKVSQGEAIIGKMDNLLMLKEKVVNSNYEVENKNEAFEYLCKLI